MKEFLRRLFGPRPLRPWLVQVDGRWHVVVTEVAPETTYPREVLGPLRSEWEAEALADRVNSDKPKPYRE